MSDMFYRIVITVKRGECEIHKLGDKFEIYGPKLLQGGVCVPALTAMYPYVNAMKYGGQPYILQGKDTYEVCCPDPKNPVIFEIERIKTDEDRPSS